MTSIANLNPLDQQWQTTYHRDDAARRKEAAERRGARAVVARHAVGPDDERELLAALGLEGE